jgi:hypothetical protein
MAGEYRESAGPGKRRGRSGGLGSVEKPSERVQSNHACHSVKNRRRPQQWREGWKTEEIGLTA